MTQFGKTAFVQHNNCEQMLNTSFLAILYQNKLSKRSINWSTWMLWSHYAKDQIQVFICKHLLQIIICHKCGFSKWGQKLLSLKHQMYQLLLFNKCEYESKLTSCSFIQETFTLMLENASSMYSIFPIKDAQYTLLCCST